MFATVGEKAAPVALPVVCWKLISANSKKVLVRLMCRSHVMRLGSKIRRCWWVFISSYIILRHSEMGMEGNRLIMSMLTSVMSLWISAVDSFNIKAVGCVDNLIIILQGAVLRGQ